MGRAEMSAVLALWGHAVAAAAFGMLAALACRRALSDRSRLGFLLAAGATSAWAIVAALLGPTHVYAELGAALRNFAWLGYLYALWRPNQKGSRALALPALYSALALALILGSIATLVWSGLAVDDARVGASFLVAMALKMLFSMGALMLVHNLYSATMLETRQTIRLPMVALSILWVYDLNLYTISYLADSPSNVLTALRGVATTLAAPLFGLALFQQGSSRVSLSRTATFQSLSLVAFGGYLVAMVVISSIINALAPEYSREIQVVFVFGLSLALLAFAASPRFRAWFRVKIAKHFFQHRFDYRAEWMRLTKTIGQPSDRSAPLEVRIVQAMADITESPGGALLVPDESGAMLLQARWNWDEMEAPSQALTAPAAKMILESARIIELDDVRANPDSATDTQLVPEWLIRETSAWVIVPLVHFDRLTGLLILMRPTVNRVLDWEDFDLLRVVGSQLASYIAEARGQEALAHVQQFDEFNRRFAFIMHDIKNLVSQLTLVTRNAERHADNPEFQADMIATLKNSTLRMNELLARLSQHNKVKAEGPITLEFGPLVQQLAAAKRHNHPIVIGGELDLFITADPARLSQALSHLVQNAIDASAPTEPVTISVRRIRNEAMIDVIDTGSGMTTHFIRHQLFKPFASTKDGGFGIGAYESRSLILAMNGRLEVSSQEGEGSCFRIILPIAREAISTLHYEEAMVA